MPDKDRSQEKPKFHVQLGADAGWSHAPTFSVASHYNESRKPTKSGNPSEFFWDMISSKKTWPLRPDNSWKENLYIVPQIQHVYINLPFGNQILG